MKILVPTLFAVLIVAGATPAMAGERQPGGGGCGHGCGGGHPRAGGHYPGPGGYNANINVNVNASAGGMASAGSFIRARAYEVGAVGARGPVHGGVVSTGGGYGYGYDYGAVGGHDYGVGVSRPVAITGPGYGPSRPFGYGVQGFGRRYVTTDYVSPDRCERHCGHPAPTPALRPAASCDERCDEGHGHSSTDRAPYSGTAYSVREHYSERVEYAEGYPSGHAEEDAWSGHRGDAPRYRPIPYHAAPLEPVTHDPGYAPPVPHTGYVDAPAEPEVHQPAPGLIQAPADYYGDLPPGDTGEGLPYRQEPGERG